MFLLIPEKAFASLSIMTVTDLLKLAQVYMLKKTYIFTVFL